MPLTKGPGAGPNVPLMPGGRRRVICLLPLLHQIQRRARRRRRRRARARARLLNRLLLMMRVGESPGNVSPPAHTPPDAPHHTTPQATRSDSRGTHRPAAGIAPAALSSIAWCVLVAPHGGAAAAWTSSRSNSGSRRGRQRQQQQALSGISRCVGSIESGLFDLKGWVGRVVGVVYAGRMMKGAGGLVVVVVVGASCAPAVGFRVLADGRHGACARPKTATPNNHAIL